MTIQRRDDLVAALDALAVPSAANRLIARRVLADAGQPTGPARALADAVKYRRAREDDDQLDQAHEWRLWLFGAEGGGWVVDCASDDIALALGRHLRHSRWMVERRMVGPSQRVSPVMNVRARWTSPSAAARRTKVQRP